MMCGSTWRVSADGQRLEVGPPCTETFDWRNTLLEHRYGSKHALTCKFARNADGRASEPAPTLCDPVFRVAVFFSISELRDHYDRHHTEAVALCPSDECAGTVRIGPRHEALHNTNSGHSHSPAELAEMRRINDAEYPRAHDKLPAVSRDTIERWEQKRNRSNLASLSLHMEALEKETRTATGARGGLFTLIPRSDARDYVQAVVKHWARTRIGPDAREGDSSSDEDVRATAAATSAATPTPRVRTAAIRRGERPAGGRALGKRNWGALLDRALRSFTVVDRSASCGRTPAQ